MRVIFSLLALAAIAGCCSGGSCRAPEPAPRPETCSPSEAILIYSDPDGSLWTMIEGRRVRVLPRVLE